MNYPLISEYIQSIKLSEENFSKLSALRPVLDSDGNPIMSSGNFAVVFKMEDKESGKLYAVKCFLREQEGRDASYKLIASELEYVSSTYLTPIQYLDRELFVDTAQGTDTEFPVLLMDWVDGITLDKYVRTNIDDSYRLSLMAYLFCRMGSWLLGQEFAHGDLKPDNIMVREDGQLVLVDYDGMFVPAMRGQKARELGSVDYRHPLRTEDVFNGSIDDFSIASIALSLKAISLRPGLLSDFGAGDRLLFCARDYQNIGGSECLKAIQSLSDDVELAQLLGLFYIAYARNDLSSVFPRLFNIARPEYVPMMAPKVGLSTEVTDEDWSDAVEDEYGVRYSRDGLRLLGVPIDIEKYKIKNGTKVICNSAFESCMSLCELVIPSSVTSIGNSAFSDCGFLRELEIPSSVTRIGGGAFNNCPSLLLNIQNPKFRLIDNSIIVDTDKRVVLSCLNNKNNIIIPSSVTSIGERAFSWCSSLRELVLPSSVTSIGNRAFSVCSSLRKLVIPSSVTSIGDLAFNGCESLRELVLPSSVTSIGNSAFKDCKSLRKLVIPSSVTSIEECAFCGCESLRKLAIPSSVTSIGNFAFDGCDSLCELVIPSSVTSIGNRAFSACSSLRELVLPSSVTRIGDGAFNDCPSLLLNIRNSKFRLIDNSIIVDTDKRVVLSCLNNKDNIIIPSSVTSIEDYAFWWCSSLRELEIPSSVTSIGKFAFASCRSLRELEIPSSVTSIGEFAFASCRSLRELEIPSSVTSIGNSAFKDCKSLRKLAIPSSVTSIGNFAFDGCESLCELVLPSSVTSIGERAFRSCISLTAIIVPKGQTERFKELLKDAGCDLSIIKEQDK